MNGRQYSNEVKVVNIILQKLVYIKLQYKLPRVDRYLYFSGPIFFLRN